jgi:hypothetical protein
MSRHAVKKIDQRFREVGFQKSSLLLKRQASFRFSSVRNCAYCFKRDIKRTQGPKPSQSCVAHLVKSLVKLPYLVILSHCKCEKRVSFVFQLQYFKKRFLLLIHASIVCACFHFVITVKARATFNRARPMRLRIKY